MQNKKKKKMRNKNEIEKNQNQPKHIFYPYGPTFWKKRWRTARWTVDGSNVYNTYTSISTIKSILDQFERGDMAIQIQNTLGKANGQDKQMTILRIPGHYQE